MGNMRLILADARPSLTDASGTCAYSILPIHPRHPGTGFCLHLLPGSDLTYALLVARRAIQNLWAAYRIASGWPTIRPESRPLGGIRRRVCFCSTAGSADE